MSTDKTITHSTTGGGNPRVTISEGGYTREITRTDDGIVVTDTNPKGESVTGPGATGIAGDLESATRIS